MTYQKIGEKIKVIDRMGLYHKETNARWNIRTDGIRDEVKSLGPCNETIRNWFRGEPGQEATIKEMVDVLNKLFKMPRTLHHEDFSDEIDMDRFMRIMGYNELENHKSKAALWAEKHLPGERFVLDKSKPDDVYHQAYTGLYQGWRTSQGKKTEIRMAIGYVSPISPRRTEKRRYLPCFLSVVSPNGKSRYRYRGAFSRMTTTTYVFHQVSAIDPDMIVMMMEKGDADAKSDSSGHMLTASEGPHHKTTPFDVKLSYVGKFASLMEMEKFLSGADKPAAKAVKNAKGNGQSKAA